MGKRLVVTRVKDGEGNQYDYKGEKSKSCDSTVEYLDYGGGFIRLYKG